MLGCPVPCGDCNNENAKPLDGTLPSSHDSFNTLLNKLNLASLWPQRTVYWRRAYMISCLIILALIWGIYSRFPTENELLLGIFIAFSVLCLSFNFYTFHLSNVASERINKIINILRDKR